MSFKEKMLYEQLSDDIAAQITKDRAAGILPQFGCSEAWVVRRDAGRDKANLLRPAFVRDCEKILHSKFFNRYADKTQVFSFYKNDDITRRAQHVQLVSRIARNIGNILNLNIDLIEAIALGHDLGHTPFGHAGERILDELYSAYAGRHFQHNVHSVRVLDKMMSYNLTLQTLNGILCHNGELELEEYRPQPMDNFSALDAAVEHCYLDFDYSKQLVPSTLEGCVVRICDIISYLGKDRQDAVITGKIDGYADFPSDVIGSTNAEIINNLTVNIIENSYGKPYIKMDKRHYDALALAKKINYEKIYLSDTAVYDDAIRPMMQEIYERLREDLTKKDVDSPIYRHHIAMVESNYYKRERSYTEESADQIVVDFIAGMTDDYFLDLYRHLFPESKRNVNFMGYFGG